MIDPLDSRRQKAKRADLKRLAIYWRVPIRWWWPTWYIRRRIYQVVFGYFYRRL